jgi:hypothetical protein
MKSNENHAGRAVCGQRRRMVRLFLPVSKILETRSETFTYRRWASG